MILLDGSFGEGGGQILRSSVGLALVTGRAVRLENIRAGREKPGLRRQHLTAVQAAAEVGAAEVKGNRLGSMELTFTPKTVKAGAYNFSVGTAGSATLVLQTVLPALMGAKDKSVLTIEGGTHNPMAPPFDFLVRAFLPVLERMGWQVRAELERPGFFPAGGGRIKVTIEPAEKLDRVELIERGEIVGQRARALVARLPRHIAERELKVIRETLGWDQRWLEVEEVRDSAGPGNVLTAEIESENITEVFSGFGEKGWPAEKVAESVAAEVGNYLAAEAPVGQHLADQLMIPMALAGGGRYRTSALTEHSRTNIEVIRKFLDVEIEVRQINEAVWEVEIQTT